MFYKAMVKLQKAKQYKKNSYRYFINIPVEYIKLKKWKGGEDLAIGFDQNGNLVIKKV